MAKVALTPARRAMLQAVADGGCRVVFPARSAVYYLDARGIRLGGAACSWLSRQRLIAHTPTMGVYGQPLVLTAAGVAALEASAGR